jgi:hypothetical protein
MGFSEKASCRPYKDCYKTSHRIERREVLASICYEYTRTAKKRDRGDLKNTGHGGLDTWFSGHGGGKPDERATWGEKTEKKADFYRQVSAPDSLSSYSNGTPVSRHEDDKAESSSLPNGDTARNIGRPSPDSPNLKYRNLDKSEANGRTPANKLDLGYVHDSGSGSARVIPYDSGYANNSSILRVARRYLSDDK